MKNEEIILITNAEYQDITTFKYIKDKLIYFGDNWSSLVRNKEAYRLENTGDGFKFYYQGEYRFDLDYSEAEAIRALLHLEDEHSHKLYRLKESK